MVVDYTRRSWREALLLRLLRAPFAATCGGSRVKRFDRGEQVIIVEDVRVMLGGRPTEAVYFYNGELGRIENVWAEIRGHYAPVYDVRVGKRDIYTYSERHLRRPSPLEILARVAK